MLVKTAAVEVTVGPFDVWRHGFELVLAVSTAPAPSGHVSVLPWPRSRRFGRREPLFGVEYADGSRAANSPELQMPDPETALLMVRGVVRGHMSGSFFGDPTVSRSSEQRFWVSPLPPHGPVRLYCAWPEFDIPETHVELNSTALTHARRV